MTLTYLKTSASLGSLHTSGFSVIYLSLSINCDLLNLQHALDLDLVPPEDIGQLGVIAYIWLLPFNCDLLYLEYDNNLDLPEDIRQLGVIAYIRLLLLMFTPVTFHKNFF